MMSSSGLVDPPTYIYIYIYIYIYNTIYKQNVGISILNDKIQKLVNHFTCLGSTISPAESDINIFTGKT